MAIRAESQESIYPTRPMGTSVMDRVGESVFGVTVNGFDREFQGSLRNRIFLSRREPFVQREADTLFSDLIDEYQSQPQVDAIQRFLRPGIAQFSREEAFKTRLNKIVATFDSSILKLQHIPDRYVNRWTPEQRAQYVRWVGATAALELVNKRSAVTDNQELKNTLGITLRRTLRQSAHVSATLDNNRLTEDPWFQVLESAMLSGQASKEQLKQMLTAYVANRPQSMTPSTVPHAA